MFLWVRKLFRKIFYKKTDIELIAEKVPWGNSTDDYGFKQYPIVVAGVEHEIKIPNYTCSDDEFTELLRGTQIEILVEHDSDVDVKSSETEFINTSVVRVVAKRPKIPIEVQEKPIPVVEYIKMDEVIEPEPLYYF